MYDVDGKLLNVIKNMYGNSLEEGREFRFGFVVGDGRRS